ncbi:MAG: hypothetical protein L3K09_03525 [Thermoplasmata archaeon]|nr:hypothetical protein [Thermoplasmata archaeon]
MRERQIDLECSAAALAASRSHASAMTPGAPRPQVTPPVFGLYNMQIAYDSYDGYVLLLGATGGSGAKNGTETWSFHAGNWTRLYPTSFPESCVGSSMAYDEFDSYVVYLGGANLGYGGNCSSAGETWSYRGGSWSQLTPNASPPARQAAAFTNDSADGYLLLFGGMATACGGFCNDSWTFVSGNWSEIYPTTSPSPRSGAGMTYDAAAGFVLLFGGSASTGCPLDDPYCTLTDTWEFQAGVWTQLSPVGYTPPEPFDDGLVYDAVDQYALYTVADDNNTMAPELYWAFQGGNWTDLAGFIAPRPSHARLSSGPRPIERFGEALAYDWNDGYALLFGGSDLRFNPMNDTWAFHAGNWTNLTNYSAPPPSHDLFNVTFRESGLPVGVSWSVSFGNLSAQSTWVSNTSTILVENLFNGTYGFVFGNVSGYTAHPSSGVAVVSGVDLAIGVTFSPVTAAGEYTVTFNETGLPVGTSWSVELRGQAYSSSTKQVIVPLLPGSYPFVVNQVSGFSVRPNATTVTILDANVSVGVRFVPDFTVTFEEQGLPNGTVWWVALGSLQGSTGGSAIAFGLAEGTYNFTVSTAPQYSASPGTGSLQLISDLTVLVVFSTPSNASYDLTFVESGLPSGTSWSVTVDGTTVIGSGSTLGVQVHAGAHAFQVGTVTGFSSVPYSGVAEVNSSSEIVPVAFSSVGGPGSGPGASGGTPDVALLTGTVIAAAAVGAVLGVALTMKFGGRRPPASPPSR